MIKKRSIMNGIATMALVTVFTASYSPVQAATTTPTYTETSGTGPYPSSAISPNTVISTGGGTPSCQNYNATGVNGWSTFSSQVSPTPTFQWAYNVTSTGAAAVNLFPGGDVTVWLSSGTVWSAITKQTYNLNVGSTYKPHTEPWYYQFHGSVANWQLQGGGSEPVANGDIVTLYFTTSGYAAQFTDGPIACQVEQ